MEENFVALEKYNFWSGHVPELGFSRKDYADKMADRHIQAWRLGELW